MLAMEWYFLPEMLHNPKSKSNSDVSGIDCSCKSPDCVIHSIVMKVRLRVRLKSVKSEIMPVVVVSSPTRLAFGPDTELEEKRKKNRQHSAENALANESEIRRLYHEGLSVNELARMFKTSRSLVVCVCRNGDLKWACEKYIEEGMWFSRRGDPNAIELKAPEL